MIKLDINMRKEATSMDQSETALKNCQNKTVPFKIANY